MAASLKTAFRGDVASFSAQSRAAQPKRCQLQVCIDLEGCGGVARPSARVGGASAHCGLAAWPSTRPLDALSCTMECSNGRMTCQAGQAGNAQPLGDDTAAARFDAARALLWRILLLALCSRDAAAGSIRIYLFQLAVGLDGR